MDVSLNFYVLIEHSAKKHKIAGIDGLYNVDFDCKSRYYTENFTKHFFNEFKTNLGMDLCVFGCADSHDWLRYIKDMFTTELKEHPQLGCRTVHFVH